MPNHDIIVVGASAGGVEALMTLVRSLPRNLPAAVFVVLHIPAHAPSMLPTILNRVGALPAVHGVDRARIVPGHIYVAPPDHHLLVEHDHMHVVRGPRENRHRPAVDPLFRTAAHAYGPRVIGVVLTGSLDDGTAGLQAIKTRGGIAVVQDPEEALYPSMPRSAIQNVEVDHVMPMAEIGPRLIELAQQPADDESEYPVSDNMELESKIAGMGPNAMHPGVDVGPPSDYSCPECGGVLHEIHDGELLRLPRRSCVFKRKRAGKAGRGFGNSVVDGVEHARRKRQPVAALTPRCTAQQPRLDGKALSGKNLQGRTRGKCHPPGAVTQADQYG